ncbi:TraR/DksA family transcriptional regulator [Agromyces mangrovi Wang et al. 2018]|uniref:TraR/DksA family transcriptional regulator n=1 Tax=Agromyces mangrovi TaxID=1858653 RepID=UPI002572F66E|nr:TraR/DksA C4-type zinc finger protein [Agromyces mangrovi]BDZ63630.1 DnaK suppressor protein [Agromyces mangrovi]
MDSDEFRALLVARREEFVAAAGAHDATERELASARGDSTADDEHDPEGVTISAEWSQLAGLREAERRELEEIDAAFARLEAGTWGTCVDCGRRIPVGRLRVRPEAARCVEDAARAER